MARVQCQCGAGTTGAACQTLPSETYKSMDSRMRSHTTSWSRLSTTCTGYK
jgi:hypothetical protein